MDTSLKNKNVEDRGSENTKKPQKNAQRNENLAELKAKFKNISKSAADLPYTFGYF
jgi:hypothetical protein